MKNEVAVAEATTEGMIQKAETTTNLSVFSSAESFSLAMQMANALSKSTVVPDTYRGNPSNCLIAIEMASRISTSPMMVMQNLYIVNGKPAWSSQWIIAMINNSKRYKTQLQFDMVFDKNHLPVSCMAWAEDHNGNKVVGPTITMEMAKAEGWTSKSGSKWKTMPEVMIRYRAASFFGRLHCPDMIMGIYSKEEVLDAFDAPATVQEPEPDPVAPVNDRPITKEEKEAFMQAIVDRFDSAEKRNEVYYKALATVGLTTTSKMKASQLDTVMDAVLRMAEEEDAGDMVTAEADVVEDVAD